MAERPDLDAIEVYALSASGIYWDEVRTLLTYARELEAENKRLRALNRETQKGIAILGDAADRDDQRRYAKWLAAAGDCGP